MPRYLFDLPPLLKGFGLFHHRSLRERRFDGGHFEPSNRKTLMAHNLAIKLDRSLGAEDL
jgi:hypothetical protein